MGLDYAEHFYLSANCSHHNNQIFTFGSHLMIKIEIGVSVTPLLLSSIKQCV